MSGNPETLTNAAGVVVFEGTTSEGGGSQPGGAAIYGDASDGDVMVDSDMFTWPDQAGISVWQPGTVYAPGDRVLDSGGTPRAYVCITGGTSGNSEPFNPGAPGRRGNRVSDRAGDADNSLQVFWEQETGIIGGVFEGPIFADHYDDGGHTLVYAGWIVFARTSATISGTVNCKGDDAVGPTKGANQDFGGQATLLGQGIGGVDADPGFGGGVTGKNSQDGTNVGTFETWGGGIGGAGGVGDGGFGGASNPNKGSDVGGYTLARRSLLTLELVFFSGTQSIGSSGGSGAGDGAAFEGGGSGAAGHAVGIFARALDFTGAITCKGGDGGDGDAGGNTGGGGGGSGGCCVLLYDAKTGAGTVDTTGGAGGAGHGTGTAGGDGSPGDLVELVNS